MRTRRLLVPLGGRVIPPFLPGMAVDMNAALGTDTTTDGGAVGSWTDQITGTAFTQGTLGNKPTYKLGQSGGQPSIRFVSANSTCLIAAACAIFNSPDITIYVVASVTSDITGSHRIMGPTTAVTGGFNFTAGGTNGSPPNAFQVSSSVDGVSTTQATTIGSSLAAVGVQVPAIVLDHTTPAEIPYYNGVQVTANINTAAYTAQSVATAWGIGAPGTGATNFFEGSLYRLMTYAAVHTPAQVQYTSQILKALYGVIG